MEDLLVDVREFLSRRNWYIDRGIPYRRGFLLYGPPGTGKSSAVVALASALGMDISMLSLGDSNLDDNGITDLLSDVPVNSIVLMEISIVLSSKEKRMLINEARSPLVGS